MKSIAMGLTLSLMMLGALSLAAQEQQTITGEVMDSSCAKMGSHEMMEKQHNMPSNAASDKACTLACVKVEPPTSFMIRQQKPCTSWTIRRSPNSSLERK